MKQHVLSRPIFAAMASLLLVSILPTGCRKPQNDTEVGGELSDSSATSDQSADPSDETGSDPVDILSSGDFSFAMGWGGMEGGFSVIEIDSGGECRYTFATPTTATAEDGTEYRTALWRKATFLAGPTMEKRLRQMLVDIDFAGLNPEYHGGEVDGTQWLIRVNSGDKRKFVYCDNLFPPAVVRLSDFIHQKKLFQLNRYWGHL